MRTKALFAAAAILAAGAASSMAQSNVYSLNVVGYVNVVIKGGGTYNLVANPLNSTNNALTNIFKTGVQDGDVIFTWNPAVADFDSLTPAYSSFFNAWDANVALPPGKGFFYVTSPTSTDFTNTFVGEVIQGNYTNIIFGSGAYNAVGSSAPIGGSFTNAIAGFAAQDGDVVLKWNTAIADFDSTTPSYSSFFNAWDNTTLPIAVGEGLFYVSSPSSSTAQWVRNFTVP